MRFEATFLSGLGRWGSPPLGWRISRRRLADVVVAVAVCASMIVFSEPAIADVLMAAVICGVPLLTATRFGTATLLNGVMWLIIVALGVGAAALSPTFGTALTHQIVTLYLVAGAVVLAGYIAADPVPRFTLVIWCYTIACCLATLTACIGFFNLLPGAFDLFTGFGRGRGTFKDPNVYGAALVPALTFMGWIMLRGTQREAYRAGAIFLFLGVGLLISFSRGAWIATGLSLALQGALMFVGSRRRSDFDRFARMGLGGAVAITLAFAAALQIPQINGMLQQRASLDQNYDNGREGRFGGQQKARTLILENPLGIGTHTFRKVHHHEEPHNVYLSTFLNAGWAGGLLFLITTLATLAIGLREALRRGQLQMARVVAGASFAAIAFEGLVIDTDHWRHLFFLMACVWGLADAAPLARSETTKRATDP